jgi:hypothetical protein
MIRSAPLLVNDMAARNDPTVLRASATASPLLVSLQSLLAYLVEQIGSVINSKLGGA